MIYELALVAKSELVDEQVKALQAMVTDVVTAHDGEVLLTDDWGVKKFSQPNQRGIKTGRYVYFMFKANKENNVELNRRIGINEGVLNSLLVKVADSEAEAEALVKKYKTPFSKKYNGSIVDDLENEEGAEAGDRRKFARRKNCWFSAKGITADWKDPKTFNWLLNEFGKISPARVSGISRKHQRFANTAIKRARNIGIVSYVRGQFLE